MAKPEQWWVLRYSPGPLWPSDAPPEVALAGHREFLFDLHAKGHVVAAGPTPDRANTAQTVIRGFDEAEINEVVSRDPTVVDGRVNVELTPWLVVLTGSPINREPQD